jgi:hypothetical protein
MVYKNAKYWSEWQPYVSREIEYPRGGGGERRFKVNKYEDLYSYLRIDVSGNIIMYCTDNPVLTKRSSGVASVADWNDVLKQL